MGEDWDWNREYEDCITKHGGAERIFYGFITNNGYMLRYIWENMDKPGTKPGHCGPLLVDLLAQTHTHTPNPTRNIRIDDV